MRRIYKISGMNCPGCAALLEDDLKNQGFICRCSYTESFLEVELKDEKQGKIVLAAIQKAGCKVK